MARSAVSREGASWVPATLACVSSLNLNLSRPVTGQEGPASYAHTRAAVLGVCSVNLRIRVLQGALRWLSTASVAIWEHKSNPPKG